MNKGYSFYSHTRFFALTLDKLGCGSTIKINGFHHIYFVLSSPWIKISRSKMNNRYSFYSLTRFFALTLQAII